MAGWLLLSSYCLLLTDCLLLLAALLLLLLLLAGCWLAGSWLDPGWLFADSCSGASLFQFQVPSCFTASLLAAVCGALLLWLAGWHGWLAGSGGCVCVCVCPPGPPACCCGGVCVGGFLALCNVTVYSSGPVVVEIGVSL